MVPFSVHRLYHKTCTRPPCRPSNFQRDSTVPLTSSQREPTQPGGGAERSETLAGKGSSAFLTPSMQTSPGDGAPLGPDRARPSRLKSGRVGRKAGRFRPAICTGAGLFRAAGPVSALGSTGLALARRFTTNSPARVTSCGADGHLRNLLSLCAESGVAVGGSSKHMHCPSNQQRTKYLEILVSFSCEPDQPGALQPTWKPSPVPLTTQEHCSRITDPCSAQQ